MRPDLRWRWPRQSYSSWFGYTSVWRRLHRADECLIAVEPVPQVIGQALNDELRLQGARIPMSAGLPVFGLTPSLLMAGLQKQAERYKADLKSSQPAESAHTA